jgi:DNA-directed RNA polymerase alpha subunit
MSFSLKKNYYHFNPSIVNFNLLNEFDQNVSKKKLENLFRKQKISFVWRDVELECVNALRRTIIANISTYSIGNVHFYERPSGTESSDTNEFYLYSRKRPIQNNEQIKLRLELLPLKQNIIETIIDKINIKIRETKKYELIEIENDKTYIVKKSTTTTYKFKHQVLELNEENLRKIIVDNLVIEFDTINSKNQKNLFIKGFADNLWLNVNTEYLDCFLETYDENLSFMKNDDLHFENTDIFVENYLITRLKRGQYLKFRANITYNNGSNHSKHTPVCSVSYMPIPNYYLEKPDLANHIDELNNMHWSHEQDIPEEPRNFLFHLQSLEYETPEKIMELGFNNLIEILKNTKDIFEKMDIFIQSNTDNEFDREILNVRSLQEKDNFFIEYYNDTEIRFILINVGFTFIHWFQYLLLKNNKIEYCGYQNPHPKIKEMIC